MKILSITEVIMVYCIGISFIKLYLRYFVRAESLLLTFLQENDVTFKNVVIYYQNLCFYF